MQEKKNVKRSIKIKLIFWCMLLILLMGFILCVLFYNNSRQSFLNKEKETIGSRLSTALINIEQDYLQIQRFAHSLSNNQQVSDYLLITQDEIDKQLELSKVFGCNQASLKQVIAYDEIYSMLLNYGISDFVEKSILVSKNHNAVMSLGYIHGHRTDGERMIGLSDSWEKRFPVGIIPSPFFYTNVVGQGYVIPVNMKIYAYNGSRYIGDVYIALSDKWLIRQLGVMSTSDSSKLLIEIGDHVYLYENGNFIEKEEYRKVFLEKDSYGTSSTYCTGSMNDLNQESYIVASSESGNIRFAQMIPEYKFEWMKSGMDSSMIKYLILMIAAVFILYCFLNVMIKKPIHKICGQLYQISKGDFTVRNEIHSEDEFQLISQEIVKMAENLDRLLKKTVEDEKLKQNYQFQMLQNQINPHFLYNTLNSIRWMGEMNGIPGIVDMTTTFAKLLRQIFRSNSMLVPLREELLFIEDYGILQSYRYGNAFHIEYVVEDEKLYDAQIIKFTLQPLVENAVFHGIEPSRSRRTITICAKQEKEDLLLSVTDNGVGIEEEDLEKLNHNQGGKSDKMSGIGIRNIHERISIEYGEGYGVHIDSKVGEYTCVTVRIPLIMEKQEEAKNGKCEQYCK